MTKFTAGPWKIYHRTENISEIVSKTKKGIKAICAIYNGKTLESQANAHLIVNAPDLLDILKECIKYLDSGDYPENKMQYKLYSKSVNIISKAEGTT